MALIVGALVSCGAAAPGDYAAIDAQTRKLERAFETKQFASWHRILSAGFRAGQSGPGKSAFIKAGKAEAARALPPISVKVHNVRFENLRGGDVRTEAKELTCYTFVTRKLVRHRLCYRQHFTETWSKERGVWKLTAIDDLPGGDVQIDGKHVSRAEARSIMNSP
jgi:hypothetical protein